MPTLRSRGSVYDGNDGGIWRSPPWRLMDDMNTNIAITQFQGVALHRPNKGSCRPARRTMDEPAQREPSGAAKWFHADSGTAACPSSISRRLRMFTPILIRRSFMGLASDIGGAGGPGSWPFVGAYFGYGPAYYTHGPDGSGVVLCAVDQHPAFTPNVSTWLEPRLPVA